MDTPPSPPDLATLITATREGQREALDQLVQFLYEDLHRLARRQMAGERPDHTLQPTALVSEAVLRLLGGAELSFADRAHFLGAAAHAMRHALIDHARARRVRGWFQGRVRGGCCSLGSMERKRNKWESVFWGVRNGIGGALGCRVI